MDILQYTGDYRRGSDSKRRFDWRIPTHSKKQFKNTMQS